MDCRVLIKRLQKLKEQYGDEELQINFIDITEHENLKLTFWADYVPTLYILDTNGFAYHINSIVFIKDDFNNFLQDFKNLTYRDSETNYQFAIPIIITSRFQIFFQYVLKDVRWTYNHKFRGMMEHHIFRKYKLYDFCDKPFFDG